MSQMKPLLYACNSLFYVMYGVLHFIKIAKSKMKSLYTITVLLLPSIVLPYWYFSVKKIKHEIQIKFTDEIASDIETAANLVLPINSSATELASILNSVGKNLVFSDIQTKVAPSLFEALLITPRAVQISYIRLDGLFFSYYKHENKIYAIYSNSTFMSSNSTAGGYDWYTQPIIPKSRDLYVETKITKPVAVVNEAWFQSALNSSTGYASLGFSWTGNREGGPDIFLDTAKLGEKGVISLGFAVKDVVNVFSGINFNGGDLFMATANDSGRVILQDIKGVKINITDDTASVYEGRTDKIVGQISCKTENGTRVATALSIGETEYNFYCSHIDVARVSMVYAFYFPRNWGMLGDVHKRTKMTMILLIVMMAAMVITVFVFVALMVRAAWREVHLCSAYMRQMDKTAQAERKSLKQSLAFASANHDVRGYLACIKGLIELCHNDVCPSSELASNFKKIDTCADDLLAMVNSILDFSKIEAGKMQLEEGDFDMEQLLEDIADLHHPVAMKKGIDLMLDPCDGSVLKNSSVIGDRGKLKQILSNLLSNAVKYTPSGHIYIRAWAKKPSLENSIIASNKNSVFNRLSHVFYKNKQAYDDLEDMRTSNRDSDSMEFVFEVEDTGLGIPKDKRKSIFEDFVQVKENSSGQVGTGLGLGIVQSLVRLMGGDIEVVDKENDENGACFRFNVFLTIRENPPSDMPRQDTCSSSDLRSCGYSPRVEGSIVALLMKNDERRKMVQRYMESKGIKVIVLKQVNQIPHAIKNKVKLNLTKNASRCYSSSSGSSTLNVVDGCAEENQAVRCALLIIDANAGDFQEMCRSVAQLRKDNTETCIKVVWLEKPDTRKVHFTGLADESLPATDCIIQEPLHGSRLFKVIELLRRTGSSSSSSAVFPSNLSSENADVCRPIPRARSMIDDTRPKGFLNHKSFSCGRQLTTTTTTTITTTTTTPNDCGKSEIDSAQKNKPLTGKRFLIAEDYPIGRKIATSIITNLGGEAQVCENGQEALEIISKALNDFGAHSPSNFPYDYVLMDCQMPIMDGFEATRRIREEEMKYGIHIPIIALTADDVGEAWNNITEAGMDYHMTKPLKKDHLLQAMTLICSRSSEIKQEQG
ncbi:hypothetical protein RND81_11G146900 [Saponaria officinalis]|uniref:histidine kinase n=1 Tax=Saponaria officinalis TaxID=3572 RepID=A0AAW1HM84_SAPOF